MRSRRSVISLSRDWMILLMSLIRGPKFASSLSSLDFSCMTEIKQFQCTSHEISSWKRKKILSCNEAVPACWGRGGGFSSAPGHSGSTWVSSADRELETAPDAVLPLFSWPSFAPTKKNKVEITVNLCQAIIQKPAISGYRSMTTHASNFLVINCTPTAHPALHWLKKCNILLTNKHGQKHSLLEADINSQSYLEFISEFFFLFLELIHCFLIPASGLGLQVTGSSRDYSRLLEQSTIQGYCLDTGRQEQVRWTTGFY